MSIKNLSNDLLVESYHQAKALNLSIDFIELLRKEIERRKLKQSSKRCNC